jgi:RimJ/RimL family protein N-acetyltransferase
LVNFGFDVSLNPLDSQYEDLARSWRNDPRIFRWCRQDDLISDYAQSRWFESQSKDPTIKMYAIDHPQHGFCGVCGLTSIDRLARRAEFSLYIAPHFHGKGFGEQALKTLFTHAFFNLGFNLIWGECLEGNRAIRTFDKIGMKREGIRQQFYFKDGRLWDAHLVSMTFDQWKETSWYLTLS